MLVIFLLVGGVIGAAYFIKRVSGEHVMTLEEWQFQQRNKTSHPVYHVDNDYYSFL